MAVSEVLLTGRQVLIAIRRLEPRRSLSYKQLRDLEARGCVAPRAFAGGRLPRAYDLGDVMLLRLVAVAQADPLLARWQAWAVVAQLREPLKASLIGGHDLALVVRGGIGVLVSAQETERAVGVAFRLREVAAGVRQAVRAYADALWTGGAWVSARGAASLARPLAEVQSAAR